MAAPPNCTSSWCSALSPALGGAATPIDRLYLAGSSAHPGGGVHGACGSNAAHAALRRDAFGGGAKQLIRADLMRRIYR